MAAMEDNKIEGKVTLVANVQEGETIAKINMNELARSVRVFQSCAIIINNHHTQLEMTSSKRYLYSGLCVLPPPPIIRPGFREVCLYRKKFGSLVYGTAGVLSFDINHVAKTPGEKSDNDGTRLFLMWSVPSGFGTTYHAVGITTNKQPSRELFSDMYHKSSSWYLRDTPENSLEFHEKAYDIPIRVLSSISSNGNATWKIDIC